MYRTTTRLASLSAITLAAACASLSSSPTENVPTTALDSAHVALVGQWNFVRGCGGLTGQCRTADELSEPTRYVFRSDSVEAYKGSQKLFVANYSLVAGSPKGSGDERPTLLIGMGPTVDPRPLRVQFAANGTLTLDEGCCDRFAFDYVRAPF